MNRFTSLEFDDTDKSGDNNFTGEVVRNATFFCQEAIKYWLNGDFELALRNYSRALEKNSSFFQAWMGQLLMLIELGEYPEAIMWADKALELFPEHAELLAAKSMAYSRDARYDKALAFSDNALSKENITSRVWLARAEVMIKRKTKIAENCISKAVSIAGNSSNIIQLEAGRLLRRFNKFSMAMEYLSNSTKFFPKSPLAWFELGCCQASLGFGEAKISFEQSLNYRPKWDLAEEMLSKIESKSVFTRLLKRLFKR